MTEAKRVAVRQDLIRVARLQGAPAGHAPSIQFYRQHGRHGVIRVRAIGGYRRPSGNGPELGWCAAVRLFGLVPYDRLRSPATADVARDVYRVAVLTGAPDLMPPYHYYTRNGRHAATTVIERIAPGGTWADAARRLGLQPRPHGGRGSQAWRHENRRAA